MLQQERAKTASISQEDSETDQNDKASRSHMKLARCSETHEQLVTCVSLARNRQWSISSLLNLFLSGSQLWDFFFSFSFRCFNCMLFKNFIFILVWSINVMCLCNFLVFTLLEAPSCPWKSYFHNLEITWKIITIWFLKFLLHTLSSLLEIPTER